MSWAVEKTELSQISHRYRFSKMAYCEVLEGWQTNEEFRDFFGKLLKDSPFDAYCWETPPISQTNLDRQFEFVLTESPLLEQRPADPKPFARQFSQSKNEIAVFTNLGGDAVLVVPKPVAEHQAYPHLARFIRGGPAGQLHALWQTLGRTVYDNLNESPLWVSTAGLGVSWLHLRLDSRPKYYRYRPFTTV